MALTFYEDIFIMLIVLHSQHMQRRQHCDQAKSRILPLWLPLCLSHVEQKKKCLLQTIVVKLTIIYVFSFLTS